MGITGFLYRVLIVFMKINIYNFFYSVRQRAMYKIREYYVVAFSFAYIKVYLAILIVINVIIWLTARYIAVQIDSSQMALHYNVDFGNNLPCILLY